MQAKAAKRHVVAVLAIDQVSLFEFSNALAVFADACDHYELFVCGESESVRCANGLTMSVPRRLSALRRADTLVVPPCDSGRGASDAVVHAIRRAHARGVRIVSLCTGAFVLARAGLLDGRRAVTHWGECARFAAEYPSVDVDPSVLWVDNGDVLTSAGSAASLDLCLYLVRQDFGAELANRVARQLVVQPHRDGGQAQYIEMPMPTASSAEPFADTLAYMSAHLDDELTIAELARRARVSPRSFARHFASATGSTPYQWLLRQRVQQAQHLLETTDLAIEAVADRVGLGDATNLRKHFRRQLGTSPNAYRRAFAS